LVIQCDPCTDNRRRLCQNKKLVLGASRYKHADFRRPNGPIISLPERRFANRLNLADESKS